MQPRRQATLTQPLQCDLQAQIPKHPITTHTQPHLKQLEATVTLRQKKNDQPTPAATAAQTRYLSSSPAATLHGKTQGFALRLPPQNKAHATFMQPLQCGSQQQLANLHLSTHRTTPEHQMTTVMQPFQCDLFAQIPKHPITTHTQAHPKQLEATVTLRQKKKRPTDPSRNRRTDEVPFIAGCSHFTRKNTRFRAPASSPTHHFPSSPLPIVTTSHRHHLPSSPLPFLTTSLPHHFPSSPLPFVTTSLRHHFPSSPLPFVTTSLRHHFPSSPLPFVTTPLHHHFPSSPLPFVTTPLHHHFPSSPLPFVTTSLLHHFPSSPLPFFTASLRHHFPSSPLPFLTTSLRHHFPSSPLPFVTTSLRHHPSLTASYSFVMYCYVIYHPASFQVADFYLSVTRKYCFPTSFDKSGIVHCYV